MFNSEDGGGEAIARMARFDAWKKLDELEVAGWSPRQLAYYMSVLSASALDMCIARSGEARKVRILRDLGQLQSARTEDE